MTKRASINLLESAEAHLKAMSAEEMLRLLETAGIDDSMLDDRIVSNTFQTSFLGISATL